MTLRVVLVCTVLICTTPLRSEIVNFKFSGIVTDADVEESSLDGSVTNGTPFTGFYTYDTAAIDANTNPAVGDYEFTNSVCGVVIKVGSYVFRTSPDHVEFNIEIVNQIKDDSFYFGSFANAATGSQFVESIEWQMEDYSGTALTNDALPTVPPNLNAFPDNNYISIDGGNFYLICTVQSIGTNPTTVTNPPTAIIYPAVEVSWPSQLGYFYQVQESINLVTWTNCGRPILSTGDPVSYFARQQPQGSFFRLLISNRSE
jgi:hypothetical protein